MAASDAPQTSDENLWDALRMPPEHRYDADFPRLKSKARGLLFAAERSPRAKARSLLVPDSMA
jgi:hypothetical protein